MLWGNQISRPQASREPSSGRPILEIFGGLNWDAAMWKRGYIGVTAKVCNVDEAMYVVLGLAYPPSCHLPPRRECNKILHHISHTRECYVHASRYNLSNPPINTSFFHEVRGLQAEYLHAYTPIRVSTLR